MVVVNLEQCAPFRPWALRKRLYKVDPARYADDLNPVIGLTQYYTAFSHLKYAHSDTNVWCEFSGS